MVDENQMNDGKWSYFSCFAFAYEVYPFVKKKRNNKKEMVKCKRIFFMVQ